ncbi:hypothetical protein HY988_00205 [Candidatus Micrarchaeota archaeon]|nr:hypothetical protein [Candidatus Micrarchaeota archaeon]
MISAKKGKGPGRSGGGGRKQTEKPEVDRPPQGAWMAVMAYEEFYSKPISNEDRKLLESVKNKVSSASPSASSSDLSPSGSKKARLLELIKLGEDPKGGRFAITQAEAIVKKYLEGKIPDEHLDFEVSVVRAWNNGTIDEFIGLERKYLKTKKLSEDEIVKVEGMLDAAKTKSSIIKLISVTALRVYHPIREEIERIKVIDAAGHLLESARDEGN